MGGTELQALPCQKPSTGISPLSFSLPSWSAGKQALGKQMDDRRKRGEGQTPIGRVEWNDSKWGGEDICYCIGFYISPSLFIQMFPEKNTFLIPCNTQFAAFPASKAWSWQLKHQRLFEVSPSKQCQSVSLFFPVQRDLCGMNCRDAAPQAPHPAPHYTQCYPCSTSCLLAEHGKA